MIDSAMLVRLMQQGGYFRELSEPGAAALLPLAQSIWNEATASAVAKLMALEGGPDCGDADGDMRAIREGAAAILRA